MKANKILLGLLACGALGGLTQSCVSDAPFADGDGEGTLRLRLSVNSDLTRAEMNEDELNDNCVIYISNANGVLYKYRGIDELPSSLQMKYGGYVAEAWTGDSVPASFESRFYRGYMPFRIEGSGNTVVQLVCKIANVAVSIDENSIQDDMMTDWKVTVSNSSGSLAFDAATPDDAIAYFMMPNADIARADDGSILKGDDDWTLYTNLTYRVEGKAKDGSSFVKTGVIGGDKGYGEGIVEHAHEYILSFEYNPEYEEQGGSFINIKVVDEEMEVHEEVVGLFSRPAIKGVGFELDRQVVGAEGGFKASDAKIIKIAGFNGLKSIQITSPDAAEVNLPSDGVDLRKLASNAEADILARGIKWDYSPSDDPEEVSTSYVHFTPDFLNALKERAHEYVIDIHVVDGNNRVNDAQLRLAIGEEAVVVDDPVTFSETIDYMAIGLTTATISGTVNADDVADAKVVYRPYGSMQQWSEAAIPAAKGSFTVQLTGLSENTSYEYTFKTGELTGSEKHSFTTEGRFEIPFGDMETWSLYNNKVAFPGVSYDPENYDNFWDSGNHGSTSFSLAAKTLTEGSTTIKHGGEKSARLTSQFVGMMGVGKFAAGNLFAGKFGKTQGTSGAELEFGRPYNGSHPEALEVYVHYTPKTVGYSENDALPKNQMDQAQIFIAFANKAAKLDTSKGYYFEPTGSTRPGYDYEILGYGEKTFTAAVGSGNTMEKVTIPVQWYDKAHSVKATHIIIVCSASKYGDFFTGGDGSVMYVDDFSLIYK